MQHYLNNLRKKPKAVRAQFAFIAASLITVIFFVIWAIGLDNKMSVESNDPVIAEFQKNQKKEKLVAESEISSVSTLFGQLKRGFTSLVFNTQKKDEKPEEESIEEKVIDINAMIQNSKSKQAQPKIKDSESKTESNNVATTTATSSVGAVILIGTTTKSINHETSD